MISNSNSSSGCGVSEVPPLQCLDPRQKVHVPSRVLLYHILHVVWLQCFLKLASRREIFDLRPGGETVSVLDKIGVNGDFVDPEKKILQGDWLSVAHTDVKSWKREQKAIHVHTHTLTLWYSLVSLCTALHSGLLQGRDSRSSAVSQSFLQANNKTLLWDLTCTAGYRSKGSLVIINWWSS